LIANSPTSMQPALHTLTSLHVTHQPTYHHPTRISPACMHLACPHASRLLARISPARKHLAACIPFTRRTHHATPHVARQLASPHITRQSTHNSPAYTQLTSPAC